MRYKIIAGRVVEKRDVLIDISLDPTIKTPRAKGKRRGNTDATQIERNCRESVKSLARILNCNCEGGEPFLTLKYSDRRLPPTKEEAKRRVKNFVGRLRRAVMKATGEQLGFVLVTADRSAKTGKPVRLHHHLVLLGKVDWDLIAANWPEDEFSFRRLDGTGDYTAVARYMVLNAGYQRGSRGWSTSQGLDKPMFTTPVPVRGAGSFKVPKEANIVERHIQEDSESGFSAAYIRYVMPAEGAVARSSMREWGGNRRRKLESKGRRKETEVTRWP